MELTTAHRRSHLDPFRFIVILALAVIVLFAYLAAASTSYQSCVTKVGVNPSALEGGEQFVDNCSQWNPFPQN